MLGISYSIILLKVATCPRYILGSRPAIVYSILLSQIESIILSNKILCLFGGRRLPASCVVHVDVYKLPARKSQRNSLFIRTQFICSAKNCTTYLLYHFRRNIHSLSMHFIDPCEECIFNFWMHSLRFPLSVWIDVVFVISI